MRFALPLAAVALVAQVAAAQSAAGGSSLTLDEAISLARRNNPLFRQTVNARRSADADKRSAYASLLPSLDASLSGRYQQTGAQFVQGVRLDNSADIVTGQYGFGLSYFITSDVLFAPRVYSARQDAAEAAVTGAAEFLRSRITQQYIGVLQAQARAALQDTLLQTTKGQLELAQARQAVGAATILEVRRAEVAFGQTEVARLQAYNTAEVEKLRLFEQLGVPQPAGVTLTTKFEVTPVRFTLDTLLDLAKKMHPDLNALRQRERAANLTVKGAAGRYAPTISLFTGWGGNASQFTNADGLVANAHLRQQGELAGCMSMDSLRVGAGLASLSCGTLYPTLTATDEAAIRSSNNFNFERAPRSLNAQISLPIFDNLQRETRLQQAQIARDNERFNLRARELQLSADVTQAYLNLQTAIKTVELQEINAARAVEELTFAQERYRVGAVSFLEVTTSRGTYEQAQIDRVNSIYDYHRAYAALESAVGRPLR